MSQPAPQREDTVTRVLVKLLGARAGRSDLVARVAAAMAASAIIAVAIMAVGDHYPFLWRSFVLAYLVFVPLLAIVPSRTFAIAQAFVAVGLYIVARVEEDLQWWQALALFAQQALFFAILWRAPIGKVAVRRVVIAVSTILVVPVYWWLFNRKDTDLGPFLGSWHHFILLMVITASAERNALATVRNMALQLFSGVPIPLERAERPDRCFETQVAGGAIFATGLVVSALYGQYQTLAHLDWNHGVLALTSSCIVRMLIVTMRVAGLGCLLMGHCYLLGVRVPAPITIPLRWTNLAEAWRGSGVYMYRFAYDAYYRQFFPKADKAAISTILKITGLFLVIGWLHFGWGWPQLSVSAYTLWFVTGLSTGISVVFLRHRAALRMKAYMRDRKAPERPSWYFALAPVLVLAVLAFRGLIDDGLVHAGFAAHLAAVLGIAR
ncbi:MAG: hypothetical protein JWO36_5452 [Myxococcales bacterium]|nr:hypothetical protein [Myxococcales bacterium]